MQPTSVGSVRIADEPESIMNGYAVLSTLCAYLFVTENRQVKSENADRRKVNGSIKCSPWLEERRAADAFAYGACQSSA
jgi:hypothetical protein